MNLPTKRQVFDFIAIILLVYMIKWTIAGLYHVPTGSMEPTIKVGDRVFASMLAYDLKLPFTTIKVLTWATPKRGEIIVFEYPQNPHIDFVKRVLAVAGDKVRMENNELYINDVREEKTLVENREILKDVHQDVSDKKLLLTKTEGKEHYILEDNIVKETSLGFKFPKDGEEYIVPKDSIFVIGDNRDNSSDSRAWGEVPVKNVLGKAIFTPWSFWSREDHSFSTPRLDRIGHVYQ